MSLKHTILGFLNNQELSGYDLQKKIDNTINHFWPSTQSQIYRTLKELVNDNHVEMQIIYQDDKPNKKLYKITGYGQNELNEWLTSNLDLPNHRNQFLVQFFFSNSLDEKSIIKNLEYYKSVMETRLEFLKSNEVNNRVNVANKKKQKIINLIIQNGIMAIENEIKWIDYSIKQINENE